VRVGRAVVVVVDGECGSCAHCGTPARTRRIKIPGRKKHERDVIEGIMCLACACRIARNEVWADGLGGFSTTEGGIAEPKLTTELPDDAIWNRGTPSRWYGPCALSRREHKHRGN
jgi:hypothetical protein